MKKPLVDGILKIEYPEERFFVSPQLIISRFQNHLFS